jgi:hypothetical protein
VKADVTYPDVLNVGKCTRRAPAKRLIYLSVDVGSVIYHGSLHRIVDTAVISRHGCLYSVSGTVLL